MCLAAGSGGSMLARVEQAYPQDIPALTSLRFPAALLVMLFHYSLYLHLRPLPVWPVVERGYVAVDFFFILSGFILAHVYGRQMVERRSASAAQFVRRRFARIYPLHLMLLLCFTLLFWVAADTGLSLDGLVDGSVRDFVLHLALLQATGLSNDYFFNYPSWSISAEWFAYLTFPFLAWLLLRPKVSPLPVLGGAVLLYLLFWEASPHVFGKRLTILAFEGGIFRILPEFLLGIALYRLGCTVEVRPRWRRPLFYGALLLTLALFRVSRLELLLPLAFGLLIFATAELARGNIRTLLDHPRLVYLGEVSYSVYLVHILVFILIFAPLRQIWGEPVVLGAWAYPIMLTGAVVTVLVAIATYHLIELPGRSFVAGRREKRLPAAAVSAGAAATGG